MPVFGSIAATVQRMTRAATIWRRRRSPDGRRCATRAKLAGAFDQRAGSAHVDDDQPVSGPHAGAHALAPPLSPRAVVPGPACPLSMLIVNPAPADVVEFEDPHAARDAEHAHRILRPAPAAQIQRARRRRAVGVHRRAAATCRRARRRCRWPAGHRHRARRRGCPNDDAPEMRRRAVRVRVSVRSTPLKFRRAQTVRVAVGDGRDACSRASDGVKRRPCASIA